MNNDLGSTLYGARRLALVENLENKEHVLFQVYGKCWDAAGALPRPDAESFIRKILAHYTPKPDAFETEEYRRLLHVIGSSYKIFCMDLQGLLVDGEGVIPGMNEAIRQLRQKHTFVVATSGTPRSTDSAISGTGLDALLPTAFCNLNVSNKGKDYNPIIRSLGFAYPAQHLVAVSHTEADKPSDIELPFLYINAPRDKLANALVSGISLIERHNGTLGTDTIEIKG